MKNQLKINLILQIFFIFNLFINCNGIASKKNKVNFNSQKEWNKFNYYEWRYGIIKNKIQKKKYLDSMNQIWSRICLHKEIFLNYLKQPVSNTYNLCSIIDSNNFLFYKFSGEFWKDSVYSGY